MNTRSTVSRLVLAAGIQSMLAAAADVLTGKVVVAERPLRPTTGGAKLHRTLAGAEQENVMLSANPPVGVTTRSENGRQPSALVRNTATPESFNGAVPIVVPPSSKATWPVGIPSSDCIVAIRTIEAPTEELDGAFNVTEVARPFTETSSCDALGRKVASPPYRTLNVWMPVPVKFTSRLP